MRADLRTQVIATLGLTPLTLVFFQQVSLVGFLANLVAIPLVTLVVTPLALLGVASRRCGRSAAAVVQALDALARAGWRDARARSGPCRSRRPGRSSPACSAAVLLVLPLPWRARLLARAAALRAARAAARRCRARASFELRRRRRRPGHRGAGAHAPPRCCCSTPGRSTRARAMPASACWCRCCAPRRDAHRPAGAEPPRQRPRRRRAQRCSARCAVDALLELARRRPSAARAGARRRALRRRPALDLGRRRLRGAASARRATTTRARQVERDVVRAARRRRRPQRCCSPATSSASRKPRWSPATARPCAATCCSCRTTAAGPRRARPSSTPCGRAIAVFQAGYRNRFGHPAPEVLERYRERGIAIVASPACGAWQWRADGAAATAACERDAARRYWHHRPARRASR